MNGFQVDQAWNVRHFVLATSGSLVEQKVSAFKNLYICRLVCIYEYLKFKLLIVRYFSNTVVFKIQPQWNYRSLLESLVSRYPQQNSISSPLNVYLYLEGYGTDVS